MKLLAANLTSRRVQNDELLTNPPKVGTFNRCARALSFRKSHVARHSRSPSRRQTRRPTPRILFPGVLESTSERTDQRIDETFREEAATAASLRPVAASSDSQFPRRRGMKVSDVQFYWWALEDSNL